jgi:hypothetical protein
VEIKFDLQPLLDQLDETQKRHIPYIRSATLNNVAFLAKEKLREELPRKFILRNKWTERGLFVWKAKRGESQVAVGSTREYMKDQMDGNPAKPAENVFHSIPRRVRPNRRALVPRSKYPSKLLANKKRYYVGTVESQGAQLGIWERPKERKKTKNMMRSFTRHIGPEAPPRLMYLFTKKINIRKRWPLEQTLARVTASEWQREANRAIAHALATARNK